MTVLDWPFSARIRTEVAGLVDDDSVGKKVIIASEAEVFGVDGGMHRAEHGLAVPEVWRRLHVAAGLSAVVSEDRDCLVGQHFSEYECTVLAIPEKIVQQ